MQRTSALMFPKPNGFLTIFQMPQVWEGRRIAFDPNERVYHNHSSEFRVFSRYSYDGINLRKRIFVSSWPFSIRVFKYFQEEVQFGSTPADRFDILELHARGVVCTQVLCIECYLYKYVACILNANTITIYWLGPLLIFFNWLQNRHD